MEYVEAVSSFEEFFSNKYLEEVERVFERDQGSITIDVHELDTFDFGLSKFIEKSPQNAISAAREALDQSTSYEKEIDVKFSNLMEENVFVPKGVRASNIGDLIGVRGLITEFDDPQIKVVSAEFQCTNCGEIIEKKQDSNDLEEPYKCQACGSRKFEVHQKIYTDFQSFVVAREEKLECRVKGDILGRREEFLEKEVVLTGIFSLDDGEKYLEVINLDEEMPKNSENVNEELSEKLSNLISESFDIEDIDSFLESLDPLKFEQLISEIFSKAGWRTELTPSTGDRGIDVIARKRFPVRQKFLIQAKYNSKSNKVSAPKIQQYNSLKEQEPKVDQVVLVTSSFFTDQAKMIADNLDIKLVDREKFKTWLSNLEKIEEEGVIEIEKESSMEESKEDEGGFDPEIIEAGVSSSERNRLQSVKHIINEIAGDGEVEKEKFWTGLRKRILKGNGRKK